MSGLNGPAAIVQDKYSKSSALAERASSAVAGFQSALNASVYAAPTISLAWATVAAPSLASIPNMPVLPTPTYQEPGGRPSSLTARMDPVQIDAEFTVAAPVLNFGPAPVLNIGKAPVLPTVRNVAIPAAPTVALPQLPQFLTLTTHTFGGVDLHEDWLDKLDDIPELTILKPAPFTYTPGAEYASQLMDSLKATLNARIHGGTGLAPAVEQAIWGRARDRETQVALAREREVMRGAEALGYALPSGVLIGMLSDARREYHDKLSGMSRDIAIKQAELEQQNVKDSIGAALQLENNLMDYAYKLEMAAFQAAKELADNSLAAHNAAIEHFKALLSGYSAYASAYDTVIKAELNKVEVFKALLSAEQTKAQINLGLVQQYKAEIDGSMAVVEIYKAQVGAAKTLVELEGMRVQAGAEEIKAFVATINAEVAKADLYKTGISAEGMKQDAYGKQVQAFGTRVSAQAERARASVSKFQAEVAAKGLEWDGWKAQLQAATVGMQASAQQGALLVDGYRAGASAAEAQANSQMRRWQADIAQYEAGKNIAMQTAKINADTLMHTNDARMDAAKVGLATSSQQLASAWSMVSASANISGSVSQSI